MKILPVALLLMASMAFVLMGCSDDSALTGLPTDQNSSPDGAGTLGKVPTAHFTGVEGIWNVIDLGRWPSKGNRSVGHGILWEAIYLTSTGDTPVDGFAVISMDLSHDFDGNGPLQGKITLTPLYFEGVWEGTWTGYSTKIGEDQWEEDITKVLQGKGGDIDGMHLVIKEVFHSELGYGDIEGYIKAP